MAQNFAYIEVQGDIRYSDLTSVDGRTIHCRCMKKGFLNKKSKSREASQSSKKSESPQAWLDSALENGDEDPLKDMPANMIMINVFIDKLPDEQHQSILVNAYTLRLEELDTVQSVVLVLLSLMKKEGCTIDLSKYHSVEWLGRTNIGTTPLLLGPDCYPSPLHQCMSTPMKYHEMILHESGHPWTDHLNPRAVKIWI